MAVSTSDRKIVRPLSTGTFGFLAACFCVSFALAAELRLTTISLPSTPARLYLQDNGYSLRKVRIRTTDGAWLFLKQCGQTLCAAETTAPYKPPKLPWGALPDAEIERGTGNIRAVWLADPTERYRHGVLGDAIEAASLVALDDAGEHHKLELAPDSVFEDRKPRLADVDGDGKDEILVVRSYQDKGSALAVIELSGHGLEIRRETPAIGVPNRWLNPAGVADFDGDGQREIAIVVTPHIGGLLEFWDCGGQNCVREMRLRGFSNHAIGSRVQEMSAVGDFDGDGVADLALPSDDRRSVRVISFAKGEVAEVARIVLPAPVVTEVLAIKPASIGKPALVMGLENGTLAIAR